VGLQSQVKELERHLGLAIQQKHSLQKELAGVDVVGPKNQVKDLERHLGLAIQQRDSMQKQLTLAVPREARSFEDKGVGISLPPDQEPRETRSFEDKGVGVSLPPYPEDSPGRTKNSCGASGSGTLHTISEDPQSGPDTCLERGVSSRTQNSNFDHQTTPPVSSFGSQRTSWSFGSQNSPSKQSKGSMAHTASLAEEVQEQIRLGPQSLRGDASQHQLSVLETNPHAKECFARFAVREQELCGEWAVFYHSYSFAALIYELHAAVAAVFFKFRSQESTLPRILSSDFINTPDAAALLNRFEEKWASGVRDHHPEYRAVAISGISSLVTLGPEVSTPVIFVAGYSCEDMSFAGVLEKSLASCFVPESRIQALAAAIIAL